MNEITPGETARNVARQGKQIDAIIEVQSEHEKKINANEADISATNKSIEADIAATNKSIEEVKGIAKENRATFMKIAVAIILGAVAYVMQFFTNKPN